MLEQVPKSECLHRPDGLLVKILGLLSDSLFHYYLIVPEITVHIKLLTVNHLTATEGKKQSLAGNNYCKICQLANVIIMFTMFKGNIYFIVTLKDR